MPGPGRPKGSPNKITAMLREAIIEAATEAGNGSLVNYLKAIAVEHPLSFMTLLGKLIPSQLPPEPPEPPMQRLSKEECDRIIEAAFGKRS